MDEDTASGRRGDGTAGGRAVRKRLEHKAVRHERAAHRPMLAVTKV
jgi:hypothetical protein